MTKLAQAAIMWGWALAAALLVAAPEPPGKEETYELPKLTVSPFEGKIDVFVSYELREIGSKNERDKKTGRTHRVPIVRRFVKYVRVDRLEPGSVREARLSVGVFLVSMGEGPKKVVFAGLPEKGHKLADGREVDFPEYLRALSVVPVGQDLVMEILPPRVPGETVAVALTAKPVTVRIPAKVE